MKIEATENKCDASLLQYSNPTENFFKFSSRFMFLHYSHIVVMDTTAMLFLEIPDMQLHYDPIFDSLYIVGSCHFCLYLFSNRNFAAPLFHPTFDPIVPYFAIPLHVAHPIPPLAPIAHAAPPPASPPQVVPDIPLSPMSDLSEASGSSSYSSGSDVGYSPAGLGMANGYLTE